MNQPQTRSRDNAVEAVPVVMVVQNQGVPQDVRVASFGRTLARAGYSVEVIAPARQGQSMAERLDGFVVHRFRQPPEGPGTWGYAREVSASLWRILRTRRKLNLREPWRILHVCNPPDVLWVPFIGWSRRVVRVFDQHDLSPELYLAKGGSPDSLPYKILLRVERLAYGWADLVIAPNESYAKIAISRGRVPKERVHVVRNAPNTAVWHPHPPQPSLRDGADFVVCFVGAVGRQDGLEELIRAMAWLRHNDPSHKFLCLVAGSGDALGDAQQLVSSSNLQGSVRFLGWIGDQAALRDIVASSDVGVEPCPSNPFTDSSTMIKVTEYLAAGRPVVAYDLPEHRVTVGDAGVLVPPELGFAGLGAALLAMAKDPGRAAKLAEMARRRLNEAGLSANRSQEALLRTYVHARELGRSRGAPW